MPALSSAFCLWREPLQRLPKIRITLLADFSAERSLWMARTLNLAVPPIRIHPSSNSLGFLTVRRWQPSYLHVSVSAGKHLTHDEKFINCCLFKESLSRCIVLPYLNTGHRSVCRKQRIFCWRANCPWQILRVLADIPMPASFPRPSRNASGSHLPSGKKIISKNKIKTWQMIANSVF